MGLQCLLNTGLGKINGFFSLQSINFVILNCCPSGSYTTPNTSLKILSHLAWLGTGEEMLGWVPGGESGVLLGGKFSHIWMGSGTAPAM